MSSYLQNRVHLAPIIGLILVASASFVSCNAHDKAVRFVRNTVQAEVEQVKNNTNLEGCNPILNIGKIIKPPSVSEILSDRDELIATQ